MNKKNLEQIVPNQPQPTSVAETLSEADNHMLETIKLKRDLALANVKTALTQSENMELTYNNLILQLAMKYKLNEGDIITETGAIQRK